MNVDSSLYVPVLKGHWKQRELWDGTYTLGDYMDIMEVIAVQEENDRRQQAQQEQEMRLASGG